VLKSIGTKKRIAIIQNEFASTGIDGKLLKNNTPNFQLIEINNGSVFCACLLSNFISTLEQIIDQHQPEMIFLEASGLADPINIAEILQSEKLSSKLQLRQIYCLADAQNYFRGLQLITRFQHQLVIADTVLLNKIDLVNPHEIERVLLDIRTKNPYAKLYNTTHAQFDFETDFDSESLLLTRHFEQKISDGRPELNTVVLRNHIQLTEIQLRNLMEQLQRKCIRIKGILHLANGSTVALQTTFNDWSIQPVNAVDGPNEWIVFGEITPTELRQLFKQL